MTHPPSLQGPGPVEQRLRQLYSVSLGDLRFVAAKWLWEFMILVIMIIFATLLYIMLLRAPLFESETRLFVRLSQEQAPPRTIVTPQGATLLTPATSDVTSEIDLLLNADLVDRVIDAANLEAAVLTPPPREPGFFGETKALLKDTRKWVKDSIDEVAYALGIKVRLSVREALVRQIRTSIGVQHTTGSNVVVLSIRWPDRDVPQELLQFYLNEFLEFRLEAFDEQDDDYFERQRDAAAERLAKIEASIARMRTESGMEDLSNQRQLLLATLEETLTAERDAALRAATIRSRIEAFEAVQNGPAGGPLVLANIPDHPLLTSLDERLIALHAERLRLALLPFGQRDSDLMNETYASLVSATLGALKSSLEISEATQADAADRIAHQRERLKQIAEQEGVWNALHIDKDLAAKSFQEFASLYEEAQSLRAQRRAQLGNIVVIQAPSKPTLAAGTRNATLLAVGSVFALLAAAAWIAIREFLDTRIWRPGDLSALTGQPVLASLLRKKPADRVELALAAAAIGAHCRPTGDTTIACMAVGTQSPNAAERLRGLVAALHQQGFSEGRLINALCWAKPPAKGMREASAGGLTFRHRPLSGAGGERIGIGEVDFDTEHSALEAIEELGKADQAAQGRRLTLIATPPIFESPIALRAAQTADGVVLGVWAGHDDAAGIGAATDWLDRNGGRNLGFILSGLQRFARPRRGA